MTTVDRIEAAGGLVVRERDGRTEVLVVHRPKYDDWSLPKGKLDDGERPKEAALREVAEETGYRCRTVRRLPSVRYRDRHGRDKRVKYWLMTVVDGRFSANDEVDEIDWLAPEQAAARLTYGRDRDLVYEVTLGADSPT